QGWSRSGGPVGFRRAERAAMRREATPPADTTAVPVWEVQRLRRRWDTAALPTATALARLTTDGREALPADTGPDAGAAGGARGTRRAGRPPPRPRLPPDLRALPRTPARGVPHAERRPDVHDFGHGSLRIGRGQPDQPGRPAARALCRELRRALGRNGAGFRRRARPRPARLGRDAGARRPAQRARRGRHSCRLPDAFRD